MATAWDDRHWRRPTAPSPEESADPGDQAGGSARPPGWASAVARSAGLTAREWEVLTLLILGYSTQDMARWLSISPHTAYQHVARLRAKFHARSRAQVVARALGIALPPDSPPVGSPRSAVPERRRGSRNS